MDANVAVDHLTVFVSHHCGIVESLGANTGGLHIFGIEFLAIVIFFAIVVAHGFLVLGYCGLVCVWESNRKR